MMIRTSYVPGLDSGGGGGAGGLKEAVSLKTEPIPAGRELNLVIWSNHIFMTCPRIRLHFTISNVNMSIRYNL